MFIIHNYKILINTLQLHIYTKGKMFTKHHLYSFYLSDFIISGLKQCVNTFFEKNLFFYFSRKQRVKNVE